MGDLEPLANIRRGDPADLSNMEDVEESGRGSSEPSLKDILKLMQSNHADLNKRLDGFHLQAKKDLDATASRLQKDMQQIDQKSDQALKFAQEALAKVTAAASSNVSVSPVSSVFGGSSAGSSASTGVDDNKRFDPRLIIVGGFPAYTPRKDMEEAFRTATSRAADAAEIEDVFGPAYGSVIKVRFRSEELANKELRLWIAKAVDAKKVTVDGTITELWLTKDKPKISRDTNSRVKARFDQLGATQGFGDKYNLVPIYDSGGRGEGRIIVNKKVACKITTEKQVFEMANLPEEVRNYFGDPQHVEQFNSAVDGAIAKKKQRF